MENNLDNEDTMGLLEQIWYYQDKVDELNEKIDELELENDDLRYMIGEMEINDDEK